ncbi:MAG TPA: DUF3352 domain-containing protein [Gaiellaceae bacterium]
MRRVLAGTLAALALVAAGCGGGSKKSGSASGTSGAASLVPADATAYVAISTDLKSDQWKGLDALAGKFPAKGQVLAMFRAELQKQGVDWDRDVKPALGSELDVAAITDASGKTQEVAFTKPADEDKLNALLQKGKPPHPVHEKIGDWTVIAEKQAGLDAVKAAKDGKSLQDERGFTDAMGKLPGETVAKFYVGGSRVTQSLGRTLGAAGAALPSGNKLAYVTGALVSKDDGLQLQGTAKVNGKAPGSGTFKSSFVDEAPAGAILFLSFHGLDAAITQLRSNPALSQQLPQIEQALGVTLDQLAELFKNEVAIYVRQGTPIPEITLVSKVDDTRAAMATIDNLATRAGAFVGGSRPKTVNVGGVTAKELTIGGRFSIFYAAFAGKLVLTSSETGITGLRDGGPRLKDDATFKDATSAAGMPDSTSGLFYLNLRDGIPLLEGLARLSGQSIPSSVSGNTAPLRAFVAYGKSKGSETSFTAFLQVK